MSGVLRVDTSQLFHPHGLSPVGASAPDPGGTDELSMAIKAHGEKLVAETNALRAKLYEKATEFSENVEQARQMYEAGDAEAATKIQGVQPGQS